MTDDLPLRGEIYEKLKCCAVNNVPRKPSTVTVPVSTSADAAARQYIAELAGEITDDTLQQIETIQTELDEKIAAYNEAKEEYENGEMEYPQYDVFAREAESAQIKSEGLETVRERVEALRSLGNEKDFTPWLIEESPYQGTYGEEAKANQQSAALVAILTVALLLAGSFAYETQSGMNLLLAASQRGRGKLLRMKIGLAVIVATGVRVVIYGMELHAFLSVCETGTFATSVCSNEVCDVLQIFYVCLIESVIPQPIVRVLFALIFLAKFVCPHFIPSVLVRFILMSQAFRNALCKFASYHTVAVIIAGKVLVGVFAYRCAKWLAVKHNYTFDIFALGHRRQVDSPAYCITLKSSMHNVLHPFSPSLSL